MKIQALLSLLPIGLGLLIGCTVSPPLQKVNSLGKVTVGQLLPSYAGGSSSGRAMGRVPSRGTFLIHFLHPELPATCVDEECGEIGELVQSYGGQLYGASDRKLAGSVFDILPSSDSSKSVDEYGVLIVSDPGGKVVAIYDHANKNSVKIALDALPKHVLKSSNKPMQRDAQQAPSKFSKLLFAPLMAEPLDASYRH